MADKVNTPGESGEEGKKSEGAEGKDPKGQPGPSARETELSAALEAERGRTAAAVEQGRGAQRNYDNLRGAYGRQSQQVGTYRDLYGDLDSGGESNRGHGTVEVPGNDDMAPNPTESKLGLIAFRQTHTDLDKREAEGKPSIGEEVDVLLSSENKGEYAAFTRDPATNKVKLDVEKTLRNAYKEVKLGRYERAQAAAQQAKAESDAERSQFRKLGVISGDSSIELPEDLDLENMTPEEMIEKGLVEMDPSDPVKAARFPRKRK